MFYLLNNSKYTIDGHDIPFDQNGNMVEFISKQAGDEFALEKMKTNPYDQPWWDVLMTLMRARFDVDPSDESSVKCYVDQVNAYAITVDATIFMKYAAHLVHFPSKYCTLNIALVNDCVAFNKVVAPIVLKMCYKAIQKLYSDEESTVNQILDIARQVSV